MIYETDKYIEELQRMFGDKLPNPLHYPKQFEYFLKLFEFYNKRSAKSMVLSGDENDS